jgi:hypothetical protein
LFLYGSKLPEKRFELLFIASHDRPAALQTVVVPAPAVSNFQALVAFQNPVSAVGLTVVRAAGLVDQRPFNK